MRWRVRWVTESGRTGVLPAVAGLGGVGALAAGLLAQHLDGGRVERDDASAGTALGLGHDELAVEVGELLGDGEALLVEVDVGPAQPAGFAAAQARRATSHHSG